MSGLRCERFVELITSFLDGALGPEVESEFVDHLAGCDGCERYLDQMLRVIQSLYAGGDAHPTDSPHTR